jgi:adenosylcobinamide-phosphate synthase
VVAPLFWMVVLGLPGALAYKAINTADSMIGHLTERHEAFGWASARCDDLVNLPASRLTALWLVLAAIPLGLSPAAALRTIWRDAGHHRSPNAGWPEAAMASMTACRSRSVGWAKVAASSRRRTSATR